MFCPSKKWRLEQQQRGGSFNPPEEITDVRKTTKTGLEWQQEWCQEVSVKEKLVSCPADLGMTHWALGVKARNMKVDLNIYGTWHLHNDFFFIIFYWATT